MTQTEPREEEGFRARSRRRAIVLGVVVVIVAAAVSLLAWRSYRDQAEAEANALGQALAQAEAADDALRASVSSLAPVIQAARAVRTEAAGQLGESARSVRGLDEALRVAAALDSTVAGNPSAPPRTRAGAAAAQREDEGQLALVDPVLASLDAALNSAKSAVEASQLSAALGDLLDADHKLATAVRELSDFKVAVDRELLRLIAKWDLPPLTGPDSTADPSSGAGSGGVAADGGQAEEPSAAERKLAKQRDKAARRVGILERLSTQVADDLAKAAEVQEAEVDESDMEAVRAAAADRLAEVKRVTARTAELSAEHPTLK